MSEMSSILPYLSKYWHNMRNIKDPTILDGMEWANKPSHATVPLNLKGISGTRINELFYYLLVGVQVLGCPEHLPQVQLPLDQRPHLLGHEPQKGITI
jgi:hypothetical protein